MKLGSVTVMGVGVEMKMFVAEVYIATDICIDIKIRTTKFNFNMMNDDMATNKLTLDIAS